MTGPLVYIAGMGIISALGLDLDIVVNRLNNSASGLQPLDLFPVQPRQQWPVGAVPGDDNTTERTHRFARKAADQALAGCSQPPDAIVVGTTTGGMLQTESLIEKQCSYPEAYRQHALESVGQSLARHCHCNGPVITVSTACSSGAVAIFVAMEMLRSGMARRVLAGGADSLCRLTYFGFHSLKLIDPTGAHPLDRQRAGMSVAEGAGLMLLTTDASPSHRLQLCGTGLSCDALHATAPHPDGAGALAAMQNALTRANLSAADIDYINLHGTGTPDNDRSEAKAIHSLFGPDLPPVSSIKGATGHALAASGAIEAVIAGACIQQGFVPGNVGYRHFDPQVNLEPVNQTRKNPVSTVMSTSLGFGGNNAALIIGSGNDRCGSSTAAPAPDLRVLGWASLSGAGHADEAWHTLRSGAPIGGLLDDRLLAPDLPPRTIRRLKRLSKMALALAADTCRAILPDRQPSMISMGTAWGALSETHDFLNALIESDYRFASPTDFIGSVHNAPAGQVAMLLGAKGANITTSGGDYSFEQALLCADLMTRGSSKQALVLGADEYHPALSPLFDASVHAGSQPADGGGGLLVTRRPESGGPTIALVYYQPSKKPHGVADLIKQLGGAAAICRQFGTVLVGMPAATRDHAAGQLATFKDNCKFQGPWIDYRRLTGEVASASAMAAALALQLLEHGRVPGTMIDGVDCPLNGKGVLVLGLGASLTAMRITSS